MTEQRPTEGQPALEAAISLASGGCETRNVFHWLGLQSSNGEKSEVLPVDVDRHCQGEVQLNRQANTSSG